MPHYKPKQLLFPFLFLLISLTNAFGQDSIENRNFPMYVPPSGSEKSSVTTDLSQDDQQRFEKVQFINDAFENKVFYGSWRATEGLSSQFSSFESNNGLMIVELFKPGTFTPPTNYKHAISTGFKGSVAGFFEPAKYQKNLSPKSIDDLRLLIRIYDGVYIDKKSANLVYKLDTNARFNVEFNISTFSTSNQPITLSLKESETITLSQRNCLASLSMQFINKVSSQPWDHNTQDNHDILMNFAMNSAECNFNIAGHGLDSNGFATQSQILTYTALASLIGLINIYGAHKLRKSFRHKIEAFRISAVSLWLIMTMDYYVLVLNIVLAFIYSPYFAFICVIYGYLTFSAERKAVMTAMRIRKRQDDELTDSEYNAYGLYFTLFGLAFILQLVFIFTLRLWVIHLSALVLLPQIIHNIKRGKQYSANFYHIVLLGFSRIGLVLYSKYTPQNIFRLSPSLSFVGVYSGLVLAQVFLLLLQIKWPRLCFRRRHRKRHTLIYEDDVCSICIGNLNFGSNNSGGRQLENGMRTMETSCGHVFHLQCLKQWVENKIECPVCRSSLKDDMEDIECMDDVSVKVNE